MEWGLALSRYVHLNLSRVRELGLGKAEQKRIRAGVSGAPDPELVKRRILWRNCNRLILMNATLQQELERWFSEPAYRQDWEEIDSILADEEFLPSLANYLADANGVESKKQIAILALLGLLEEVAKLRQKRHVYDSVKSLVRKHSDIAERAMTELGPIPGIMIRRILGREIPKEVPEWVVDRADERLKPTD